MGVGDRVIQWMTDHPAQAVWAIVVGSGVLMALGVFAYWWWLAGRYNSVSALARARGWKRTLGSAEPLHLWAELVVPQSLEFEVGRVVEGTTAGGRIFYAFEYYYVRGGGDSAVANALAPFFIFAIPLDGVLPTLRVWPERAGRRATDAAGIGPDIELESEAFNRRFRIQARDPRFASAVLTPRVMHAMLEAKHAVAFELRDGVVISWTQKPISTSGLLARLDTLGPVADGIAEFVYEDFGWRPGPDANRFNSRQA